MAGPSKEEQRKKIREQQNAFGIPSGPTKIKRLIKGKIKELTKKQNRRRNKQTHKPPVIFYGYNTNST